jgi:hypothetical protein
MRNNKGGLWCGAAAIAMSVVAVCIADISSLDPVGAALAGRQQMLPLPVRVVDAAGRPVPKAKVTPWALRSSQGHGWWLPDDERAGAGPKDVVTDNDGMATILYPRYRDVKEQIRTTAVSLCVDHPSFAYVEDIHIDVLLETKGPYEVKLEAGVALEVRPLIDGKAVDLANVYAIWSDGRSWKPEVSLQRMADGVLRIPAMRPGKNSVLLVKLDGEWATHFSEIFDVELKAGESKRIDLPMHPSIRIKGALSDNVPRPVRQGRIKLETLRPNYTDRERITWFTWVPVQPDGTFVVDGWPAGEKLQLIALCDGYIAESGKAPDEVKQPPDPAKDSFHRPQVFAAESDKPIEVAMVPLGRCAITAVDEDGKAIVGVEVDAWPNVGWWNDGSQIYCTPLVRSERMLRVRDYRKSGDDSVPRPFEGRTDGKGMLTLELPAGREDLGVSSEVYELPAFLGQRETRVELTAGKTTDAVLRLQPRGTEKLGEWDKLAGVVFGCSTREGRRMCATPGVQKKIDEFIKRFREGKNQRDPKLLSEAYTAVADAFTSVGDREEAEKWRQKAAEQTAKIGGAPTPAPGTAKPEK